MRSRLILLSLGSLVLLSAPARGEGTAPSTAAGATSGTAALATGTAGVATGAAGEATVEADPTVELFVRKCASCHTVGKGDRPGGGPDLSGAHERRDRAWLERFIKAPSKMLDSDPYARELVTKFGGTRMPDLGLANEQVTALVDLMIRCSAEECTLQSAFKPITAAVPGDAERGRALFLGHESLKNGGPACVSCHTVVGAGGVVGGGLLAKDLTHVFARFGDEGLGAALASPAFPVMDRVFGDHPIAPAEAFALRAFFYETNRAPPGEDDSINVLLVAAVLAGLVLLVLNAAWSRRLRGVRTAITKAGRSAS